MKKILITLLAVSGLSFADGHGNHMDDTYYAYYSLAANNPPAVIAAMDKFADSKCWQKQKSSVSIMSELFNGKSPQTHTIVVTHKNAKEMNESFTITSACPEYAEFVAALNGASNPTEQWLAKSLFEGGDWTEDTVFQIFEMNIRNEKVYLDAYKKFTAAMTKKGQIPGSYGIERVVAGTGFSHFAFIGAKDMEQLMDFNALLTMKNSDFSTFQQKIQKNRKIVRRGIVAPLKAWD
jgi:hypothetical protein|tara:strand:- start:232 stop:939 length:708 start_codon:yes stop_codon:yes gene_type:complete